VDEIRFREQVAQESGAGAVTGPAHGLRDDVEVFDLQQVTRLGSLDVDRTGQRVGHLGIEALQISHGHAGFDLTIGRIAGFQDQFLAGGHLLDRRDIGVPAVVPEMGLFLKTLVAINRNALHGPLLLGLITTRQLGALACAG
jgi:hypothetical protein